ncbi:hypothetical protein Tco_0976127 [Tanacetum coccineum]|uniref:Uncharacterized protein n=1 Tax=Tanacetum coccineum TaxID=301880 RepID=A0ABQ5EGF5_9ASTR
MAYEALQKSILHDESEQFDASKVGERKKMKSKQDLPKTSPESPPPPPPTPPPSGASRASCTTGASDSAQDPLPLPRSLTTNPDDQFEPSASSIPEDVFMHEDSDFEAQDMVSDDEDIDSRHVPRVNLNQDWFKPLFADERPATPEPAWSIPSSSLPIPIHNWASALAFSYMEECHKILTNQVDNRLLRYNVSRPIPLGGPPGQVTIQTEFFFNRDLDYLRFGSKGDRLVLSITKMKAAYYPNVSGRNRMVPIRCDEDECMIEVFSIYGYDYMKNIVLRRADNQEYTIAENNFKDLYPSDFEDLHLLNLQGHLNHLPPRDKKILSTAVNLWIRILVIKQWVEDFQLGIKSYQTQLNLTKPRWEATGLEFMHDYKILNSPRAILFRDKYMKFKGYKIIHAEIPGSDYYDVNNDDRADHGGFSNQKAAKSAGRMRAWPRELFEKQFVGE